MEKNDQDAFIDGLIQKNEVLGDQITKLGWIACHCQDNGLKCILDEVWAELINVYQYIDQKDQAFQL